MMKIEDYQALAMRTSPEGHDRVMNGSMGLIGESGEIMRSFVVMRYVMNMSDVEIRQELNLTRRGLERARRSVEEADCMSNVKWQERYILIRE